MNINIQELTAQILCTRYVSPWQQELMSELLAQGNLGEEERTLISRVFYGVRRGLLKTVA